MLQDGVSSEPSNHGAWELFPRDLSEEAIALESPSLDDGLTAQLLGAVESLISDPAYSLFVDQPDPSASFPSREGGTFFKQNFT